MSDINRLVELYESLEADDTLATPDEAHGGFYRLIITFADNNKSTFHEMLAMLGDGVSIGESSNENGLGTKLAVVKADEKIIAAYQSADAGFMLYIDKYGNLLGEEINVFDALKIFRSET